VNVTRDTSDGKKNSSSNENAEGCHCLAPCGPVSVFNDRRGHASGQPPNHSL